MVFPYNKKTQNIILKTLEQYWLLNSMYESIDAIHCPVEMALKIPTKCVSLEQTGQHHFDINLTCSRHGIAEEFFTWR
jgi:hypothetical protein